MNIQSDSINSDLKKLKDENAVLKQNLEEKTIENSKLSDENVSLKLHLERLQCDVTKLKDSLDNPEPADGVEEVNKYKEFFKRAQVEYKVLESEMKKLKETHKVEVNVLMQKRLVTEEKYGQVIKERELFKEKERIFMETCDALTRLNDLMKKKDDNRREVPIDITGEDAAGGSSSRVFTCDKCDYKESLSQNLSDHKNAKHEAVKIPCELCDFVGKTSNEYKKCRA